MRYVDALMYHARAASEHGMLRQRIDAALSDEDRLEVEMARRTMADVHYDEGALAANKRMLLEQLRLRFKTLPAETEQAIEASQDADQVREWMHRFATANDLDAVGIVPPSRQRS